MWRHENGDFLICLFFFFVLKLTRRWAEDGSGVDTVVLYFETPRNDFSSDFVH